jgi:hypothetical protein
MSEKLIKIFDKLVKINDDLDSLEKRYHALVNVLKDKKKDIIKQIPVEFRVCGYCRYQPKGYRSPVGTKCDWCGAYGVSRFDPCDDLIKKVLNV